jgi:lipopolysaccharide/colanic/teichoic acid biosynthesis glycosyltransferase
MGTHRWLGVYPPDEFRVIFEREKARVDRNSHVFSLVTFSLNGGGTLAAKALLAETEHRLRRTDVIGWIDNKRIGVILPDTPAVGARKVAVSVCEAASHHACKPSWGVSVYPPDTAASDPHAAAPSSEARSGARVAVTPAESPGEAPVAPLGVGSELDQALAVPFPPWKRAIDVVGAGAALIVLSPVLLACAIAVKIVSPGPAFFFQERMGHLGRPFKCWKLRTMKANADAGVHHAHLQQLIASNTAMTKLDSRKDPRVIPVIGRFLRASAIDELPQLFNVLRGDMSLVGPRPCLAYEAEQFQRWQKQRFNAVPGLTGLWQVSGKNRTSFVEMMRLDIAYGQHVSPLRDSNIIARTLPAVAKEVKDMVARKAG